MNLSEWEQKNFLYSSHSPGITVIFPSREIYFSSELLHVMRLENSTCPKTLDQWYELCHPSDHSKIAKLENIIYNNSVGFFSMTRKLYCGDGFYRNFRLDAFIKRNSDGRPEKLFGNEILALSAWLETANEGDKIQCLNDFGRVKNFEAVRVQGVMTLSDLSMIEDLQNENLILRRELQRRIFYSGKSPSEIELPDSDGSELFFANILEDNINSALDILTSNAQLKALKRSIRNENIIIGVVGLSGSGKSELINNLIGEKLIPEHIEFPIFFTEGEIKSALIFYQDGRQESITDSKLTASFIQGLKDISRIEISMPGALIPKGLCIVDVPEKNKNILAELDFVIYVTPIRAKLKIFDREYLSAILGMNENIIFALSQTDLETDDTEAGKIVRTKNEKIKNDIEALKSCYSDIPVILAVPENIINYVKPLSQNSFIRGLRFRTERALKILEFSANWKIKEIRANLRVYAVASPEFQNIVPPSLHEYIELNESNESKESKSLLSSLITSMREREFKTRFFALESFGGRRSAILLSADKNQSLKLYSRLAHNIKAENFSDENEWLYAGKNIPFECSMLPALGNDENILIAPSDENIATDFNWHRILNQYIPVVSVDLARIDSGLAEFAYSPYITELAFTKWILVFGNAGLFANRQDELENRIMTRISDFIENNGLKTPNYFIYENYKIITMR